MASVAHVVRKGLALVVLALIVLLATSVAPAGAGAPAAVLPPCEWPATPLPFPAGGTTCQDWWSVPDGSANFLKARVGLLTFEGKVTVWLDVVNPRANALIPLPDVGEHGPDDIYVGDGRVFAVVGGASSTCSYRNWLPAGRALSCSVRHIFLRGDVLKVQIDFLDKTRKPQVYTRQVIL